MKLFTKTLMALLVMVGCAQFYATAKLTIVDTDYSKRIPIRYVWFDYNQDNQREASELFEFPDTADASVLIKYTDYDSAGNILTLTLTSSSGENKAVLTDVIFAIGKPDDGSIIYLCKNKYNEDLFTVTQQVAGKPNLLWVFNPSIFE